MVILRITQGIRDHFPARKSEWVLAGMMAGWGLWVTLWPVETFLTNHAYATMVSWGSAVSSRPAVVWSLIVGVMGAVRLAALIVNGTFVHTWYGWASPHVRAILSALSCFLWAWIALGITFTPGRSTGEVIFAGLMILDFLNAREAATDAGAVDRARAR